MKKSDLNVLKEAVNSVKTAMFTDSKDWSLCNRDAWIYGIIIGWENDSLDEVAKIHKWHGDDINRLKKYHKAIEILQYWKSDTKSRIDRAFIKDLTKKFSEEQFPIIHSLSINELIDLVVSLLAMVEAYEGYEVG